MFIYEPGSGFAGDCHILSPGDELKFHKELVSPSQSNDGFNVVSDLSTQVVCDGVIQGGKR